MIREIKHEKQRFENWLNKVKKEGIEDLFSINSKLIIQHLKDMEAGRNINRKSKKGKRSYDTLLTRRDYLVQIFERLENRGHKNIGKIKEEEIHSFFDDIKTGKIRKINGEPYGKSVRDQIKAFRAFWNWWIKINRKQKNILIPDICEELDAEQNGNDFVYFTLDQLKQMQSYFTEDQQVMNLFMFDTIIRSPKELMNVKVSDLHDDFEQLSIRDETSKTYGRTIKLLLCSEVLKKYVKKNKLKSNDYLFSFDPSYYNKKLQQVAKQIFKEKVSTGGEDYNKISLYDFRHSGSCYWRLGAYRSKIDALMYRGGWTNLSMLNYYTKKIGMKDSIEKSDLLVEVDKNDMEKLKAKNQELETKFRILKKRIEMFENMVSTIAPSGKIAIMDKKKDMTIIKHEDKPFKTNYKIKK